MKDGKDEIIAYRFLGCFSCKRVWGGNLASLRKIEGELIKMRFENEEFKFINIQILNAHK